MLDEGGFENPTPKVYDVEASTVKPEATDWDDSIRDEFTSAEIYRSNSPVIKKTHNISIEMLKNINDPEHPLTLAQLNVVNPDQIYVDDANNTILVEYTPTIPHCSMATLIGLSLRVKLLRSLPSRFMVDVKIKEGTHQTEAAINRQLNDKERVAAAIENPQLIGVVDQCLSGPPPHEMTTLTETKYRGGNMLSRTIFALLVLRLATIIGVFGTATSPSFGSIGNASSNGALEKRAPGSDYENADLWVDFGTDFADEDLEHWLDSMTVPEDPESIASGSPTLQEPHVSFESKETNPSVPKRARSYKAVRSDSLRREIERLTIDAANMSPPARKNRHSATTTIARPTNKAPTKKQSSKHPRSSLRRDRA